MQVSQRKSHLEECAANFFSVNTSIFVTSIALMKKFILAGLLLLAYNLCFSQTDFKPGYVITQSGDSLAGLVDYREGARSFRSCDFRQSVSQETHTYKPGELLAYGFLDGQRFETKTITLPDSTMHTVFLEALIRGQVSLYKFEQYYWVEKNAVLNVLLDEVREVYINDVRYVKHTNQHVGTLSTLMFDCAEMRLTVQQAQLNERNLTKLVEDYNRCVGSSTIIYKEKKPWIKPVVGVVAGMTISQIKFFTDMNDFKHLTGSFEPSRNFTVGLSFDILSPRLFERFSFYSEILYMHTAYYHYQEVPSDFSTNRNYITIDLKQLKIPFGARYTFPERKLTPMISAGISGTIHVKQSSTWVQEQEFTTVVQTYTGEALAEMKRNQFGLWGSLGVQYSINEKLGASLELRYEQTNGIVPFTVDTADLDSRISNFYILAGFRLK